MEAVRYKSLMEDAARVFPFGDMAKDAYDKRNQWNKPKNIHYNVMHRANVGEVLEFDRDKEHDPAFNALAAEIKGMYRFDEIAQRVIETTRAVSPDEDLRAFMAEVRKVAMG